MKAFVIKNKDGYYLVDTFGWSKKLIYAYVNESEKDLEIMLKNREDCTIVPITICECDFEEKCKELEKALELGAEKIEFMAQMLGQTLDYDVKENLIQQAKEKGSE